MGNATIFKKLKKYLSEYDITRLKLNLVLKGSVVMCYTIVDICKNYNSTQENENDVAILLAMLCQNHFKTIDSKTLK